MTDTLHEDPIVSTYGTDYPAHSWVVFGPTAEERPLRVEMVSPIVDNIARGYAISVIELRGEGEDVGDLDYRLPHGTTRTRQRLKRTTRLRNSELFNPLADPDTYSAKGKGGFPHPIVKSALRLYLNSETPCCSSVSDVRLGSHDLVTTLLGQREFSPLMKADLQPNMDTSEYDNYRARDMGQKWARAKRRSRFMPDPTKGAASQRLVTENLQRLGAISANTAIRNDQIFYEIRMPQPRLRSAPRRPPITFLFEIQRAKLYGRISSRVRCVIEPWMSLARALPLPPFRQSRPIVSLSRDPRLTSGHILASEFESIT